MKHVHALLVITFKSDNGVVDVAALHECTDSIN
jgi:hypothetical protein